MFCPQLSAAAAKPATVPSIKFAAKPVQGNNTGSRLFLLLARDEDWLIFGLPDPLLFSLDPDPTCNNRYIKLFSS